jgi:hypothetical protein
MGLLRKNLMQLYYQSIGIAEQEVSATHVDRLSHSGEHAFWQVIRFVTDASDVVASRICDEIFTAY